MSNYEDFIKSCFVMQKGLEQGIETKSTFKEDGYDLAFQIGRAMSLVRRSTMFEVDDSLKIACALHKVPKLKYDLMPHEVMFFDVDFNGNEFDVLKKKNVGKLVGILLCKSPLFDSKKQEVQVGEAFNAISIAYREGMVWLDSMTFGHKIFPEHIKPGMKLTKKRVPENAFMENFIYNILNFINDPDVKLIKIERSEKNQARRRKQGKPDIPSSIQVRLTGTAKIYVDDFYKKIKSGSAKWHYNYRFPVRSHIRRYRDDKGHVIKETMVKEYVKGQGVYVPKKYNVEVKI